MQADVAAETTVSSARIYEGRVINLRVDDVSSHGSVRKREVVEHGGAAVIIAQPDPGHLVLVRQWRHPVAAALWEAPAGGLETGEAPLDGAARELREETGYTARRLTHIWSAYSAPGFCSELLHFVHAVELTAGADDPDEGEELIVRSFALDDLRAELYAGRITDAKTQIAIMWALAAR